MKPAEKDDARAWYIVAAVALAVGLLLRLRLASLAQTPGHGDSAFYYTVAKNIVDGRGVVVDYVVYFFLGLVPLTHYAGDFWNPLAEILLSLPMFVLGKSVFNALLASIAAGVVPAIVGFFAGRRFSGSTVTGILVGILTFFSPFMVVESVRTEAIIFYGAFGSLALYFAAKGSSKPHWFVLAAMCTGLAHFVRQDGLILAIALLTCVLVAPLSWSKRLGIAAAAIAVHALMLSPLLVNNYVMYGTVLPPGPSSTVFMTSYEDFHAYGKDLSWQTLRAEWGIRQILSRRLHTAAENLAQLQLFLGIPLLFLASLGAVNLCLGKRAQHELHVLLPPLIYFVLIFGFYTVLVSFSGPGSLPKSLAVLHPFIGILVVDLFASWIPSPRLLAAVVILLAAILGFQGYLSSAGSAQLWNRTYQDLGKVRALIDEDAASREEDPASAVIMARDIWEVSEATGLRGVMIPNNDLETILFVARHYGAQYMLLPAPRKALEDIYLGTTPDPRFSLLGSIKGTDWKLYRLQP